MPTGLWAAYKALYWGLKTFDTRYEVNTYFPVGIHYVSTQTGF